MTRNLFLVMYDVRDDRRLRAVFKVVEGFGDHLQYSVFRCDLSAREHAELVAKLTDAIDHTEDQVLLVDMGPVDGHSDSRIASLGIAYRALTRRALIV